MYGYVYLTTNLINGKKYIGQRKWSNESIIDEDTYLGSGIVFKQAIAKYGLGAFDKKVLKICYSKEELSLVEKTYINDYNAVISNDYYNIHEGGFGGNTRAGYSEEEMLSFKLKMKTARKGYSHSVETRKKISDAGLSRVNHMKLPKYRKMFSEKFKGANNPMYGRKLSDEQKKVLRDSHNGFYAYNKGKVMDNTQKDKISDSLRKAWNDPDTHAKWSASRLGRVQSEETRKKMSLKSYERYGSFPMDNNLIIYQYNKDLKLVNVFKGIDEYYSFFRTKTCRNLKYAIRDGNLFKSSYWKVEFKSQSTIESIA